MEPIFLDQGCNVFMNESKIKIELKVKGLKKFQVFNLKMMMQCNWLWKI